MGFVMPNHHDIQYQADEIRRKLLLISGNEHLTPVERELIDDVTQTHLPAILSTTVGQKPSCVICGSLLEDEGKCPNRHKESHRIKK